MTQAASILGSEQIAFISGGVSMSAAACDHLNRPASVRLTGCRVREGTRLAVFLSCKQGERLLECVRATGAVAVVFSQPSTHRTLQIKAWDAQIRPLADGDLQTVRAYRESFADDLEPLGFTRAMVRTLLAIPPADLLALEFTPSEAYNQTPGPQAGRPLGAAA